MAFDVTLNLTVGTVVSDKDECISEEDKVREEKERFKLKGQIRTLTNFEVRVSTLLAEHPSNLTAVREEVRAKEEPNFQLERIDLWMGKQCTMECDGSCPDVFQLTEIYPCDSWRESYRKAAVSPSDECGLGCPALSQTNQCNQKCPVDCMMFEVDKPCTVEREGSCPEAPQLKEICSCGGWQKSSCTAAVSPPDECGLGCPALIQTKQCNQRKCPVDCVMSEVDKPCTVEREGSCPEAPQLTEICHCGGWRESCRTAAVSSPDDCGMGGAALTQTKQCNQRKCPVDCVMSEWPGWPECNQAVEGEVDFWVDKPCKVEREGSCPEAPQLTEICSCGGWRESYRAAAVPSPDECGLGGPALANGEANVKNWVQIEADVNAGKGKYGTRSNETDVCEANKTSTAYTMHARAVEDQARYEETDCGDNGPDWFKGMCDENGSDRQPHRFGKENLWGPGSDFIVT